jgi:hypothetical protein
VRRSTTPRLLALVAALALAACGEYRVAVPPAPSPSPVVRSSGTKLTAADVEMYLVVRNRALERLEDALSRVEKQGGDLVSGVDELSVAERRAASGLGENWQHYADVREQVGRLMALQRRQEDARTLSLELSNSRDDLTTQLQAARDPASRQFLEAQLKRLTEQLADLDRERRPTADEIEQLRLLEHYRAEIAVQQGRQERIQRRIAELLEKARATPSPGAAATPAAASSRSTPAAPRE